MNLTSVSKEKQSQTPERNDERLNAVREERVGRPRLKASLRLEEQWSMWRKEAIGRELFIWLCTYCDGEVKRDHLSFIQ